VVVSLEVVEHVYRLRTYAKTVFDLLEPGVRFVLSTPYYGYLKNLARAVSAAFRRSLNQSMIAVAQKP